MQFKTTKGSNQANYIENLFLADFPYILAENFENSSEAKKTTQQVELIFLSLKLKLELNFKMSNFLFFAYRLVATQLICFCVNFVHHHLFS